MGATMARRRPKNKRAQAKANAAKKEAVETANKKHAEASEKKHKKSYKG